MSKNKEKQKAIELRKKGFSYSEILREISIAKSTLSLWLRSVELSKKQKQRLTDKKLAAIERGGLIKKNKRIERVVKIKAKSQEEIKFITKRELWLIGIALYWAEGSKEKEHNIGQGVTFSNSDSFMIKVFLKWLRDILEIKEDEIRFEIYIHENAKNNIRRVINYWVEATDSCSDKFKSIYFKKHKVKTERKNINDNYYGLLRVKIKKSSNLNRRITGWIEGVYKNCGIV